MYVFADGSYYKGKMVHNKANDSIGEFHSAALWEGFRITCFMDKGYNWQMIITLRVYMRIMWKRKENCPGELRKAQILQVLSQHSYRWKGLRSKMIFLQSETFQIFLNLITSMRAVLTKINNSPVLVNSKIHWANTLENFYKARSMAKDNIIIWVNLNMLVIIKTTKNQGMANSIIVILQWLMRDIGKMICQMEKGAHMILKEIKVIPNLCRASPKF